MEWQRLSIVNILLKGTDKLKFPSRSTFVLHSGDYSGIEFGEFWLNKRDGQGEVSFCQHAILHSWAARHVAAASTA